LRVSLQSLFSLQFVITDLHSGPNAPQTPEPPLQSCCPANSLPSGFVLVLSIEFCPLYWTSLHFFKMYQHFVQIILNFLVAPECLQLCTASGCQRV